MTTSLQQIKPKAIIIIVIFIVITVGILLTIAISGKPQIEKNTSKSSPSKQEVIPPLENRPSPDLKAQDLKKQLITSKIGENNGTLILYKTLGFEVDYVPTPDIFFVKIFQKPFDINKKQAEEWFKDKGLKQSDLCDLPVRFSVSFQAPKEEKLSYDPFPADCEK